MPGRREHLAARAMPPHPRGQHKLTATGVARSRPGEATAPGILGKQQQMNLAQGSGVGGAGGWVFCGEMKGITSVGWSRDCGGGRLVPEPGRRAGVWSESGCLRTSLVPARWCHTSCWSLGYLTCCRQRNRISPPAVTRTTVTRVGGGERLRTELSDPGFSDYGKLHLEGLGGTLATANQRGPHLVYTMARAGVGGKTQL